MKKNSFFFCQPSNDHHRVKQMDIEKKEIGKKTLNQETLDLLAITVGYDRRLASGLISMAINIDTSIIIIIIIHIVE